MKKLPVSDIQPHAEFLFGIFGKHVPLGTCVDIGREKQRQSKGQKVVWAYVIDGIVEGGIAGYL